MADSDFSLTTTHVTPEFPQFSIYASQTVGHKQYFDRNARGPLKLYNLQFNNMTQANALTLRKHYNTCSSGFRRFAWTNAPSYLRAEEHAKNVVAADGAVLTDETVVSSEETIDDMTLLPAVPQVNDAYYWGSDGLSDQLRLRVSQAGVGNWTIAWEYYDTGLAWSALAGVTDNTTGFTVLGLNTVTYTQPSDWQSVAINGVTAFYIRARVSVYAAVTTQPLGAESWLDTIPYYVRYFSDAKPRIKPVMHNFFTANVTFREEVL